LIHFLPFHRIAKAITASFTAMDDDTSSGGEEEEEEEDEDDNSQPDIPLDEQEDAGDAVWDLGELDNMLD
jgi:hypothetical protein